MLRSKQAQRSLLAEKLADVANIALGALVFGQALSGSRVSVRFVFVGAGAWTVITSVALVVAGWGHHE